MSRPGGFEAVQGFMVGGSPISHIGLVETCSVASKACALIRVAVADHQTVTRRPGERLAFLGEPADDWLGSEVASSLVFRRSESKTLTSLIPPRRSPCLPTHPARRKQLNTFKLRNSAVWKSFTALPFGADVIQWNRYAATPSFQGDARTARVVSALGGSIRPLRGKTTPLGSARPFSSTLICE